jgi:hypothetical protein
MRRGDGVVAMPYPCTLKKSSSDCTQAAAWARLYPLRVSLIDDSRPPSDVAATRPRIAIATTISISVNPA